jgi:hypothetical protein
VVFPDHFSFLPPTRTCWDGLPLGIGNHRRQEKNNWLFTEMQLVVKSTMREQVHHSLELAGCDRSRLSEFDVGFFLFSLASGTLIAVG